MDILVTGSAGFIGSHLVDELEDQDHVVTRFDRADDPDQDVADQAAVMEAVEGQDHVFHLAAEADVWDTDYEQVYQSNIQGLYNIVQACRRHGASMTFSSSQAAGQPTNLYARSKRAGELLLEDAEAEVGWYRFSNVVGPGTDKGQVQAMIEQALEDGEIEVWEQGRVRRSYVSVDRVVRELIVSMGATGFLGALGTRTMDNMSMAGIIAGETGADVTPVDRQTPSPTEMVVEDLQEGDDIEAAIRDQIAATRQR